MGAPKGNINRLGKLKYNTLDELQSGIDEYFDWCDNRIQHVYSPKSEMVIEVINPAPYTMSGLARRLGLSRQGLLNYTKNELFFDAIKEARDKVQEDIETRLMEKNATGAIFNLKNNFGWKDEKTTDIKNTDGSLNSYKDLSPDELRNLAKGK